MASSSRSKKLVLAAANKITKLDPVINNYQSFHSKVVTDDNYDTNNIITEINNKVFQQIMKQKNNDENITDVVTPEFLEVPSSLTSFSRETKEWLPPISKIV